MTSRHGEFIVEVLENEFTLAELAELLDMQPRTIRSYIERDLLRGPEVGGRGARYTDYHVTRLRAIRALRDLRGLPLDEVRRRLLTITAQELASLAAEGAVLHKPGILPQAGSALDYLRSLKHAGPSQPPPVSDAGSPTPLDVVLCRLDELTAGNNPPRRARGEVWVSIPITPDIELRVRGTQTAGQLSRWERIADYLRDFFDERSRNKEKK